MIGFVFLLLGILLGTSNGLPTSSCQDLDTNACALFAQAKPDLCTDPSFSQGSCKRFCGQCPLECYACPTPVLDPAECNTTVSCGMNQTCATKHLKSRDGHDEYIMMCEKDEVCEGVSFGFAFGKREILFDEESEEDIEEHDVYKRDVTLSCCDTDFCNMPVMTTTTTTTTPSPTPPTTPTTHAPHNVTPVTNECNRDIVFVVDTSGSVGQTNFHLSIDFVKKIVSQLNVAHGHAHVGFMTFSSSPKIRWYLNTYFTTPDVLHALGRVPYESGGTHTETALHMVRTELLTRGHGDRSSATNVVIVLTDGKSNVPAMTLQEAQTLHQVSHDVISIGIGHGVSTNELNAIATDRHHVFGLDSYSHLTSIIPQIMPLICNA